MTSSYASSSHSSGEPHKDVASPMTYFIVFALLIGLTILTAVCSRLPLGQWEIVVAMSIASLKAALVTLFFMHLIHMGRLNWVIVVAGGFWLALFMSFIMADYLTRSWYSIYSTPMTASDNLSDVETRFDKIHAPSADLLPDERIP